MIDEKEGMELLARIEKALTLAEKRIKEAEGNETWTEIRKASKQGLLNIRKNIYQDMASNNTIH